MAINKVILLGRVGKDPEIKNLDNNIKVATFSVATTERAYKTQQGAEVPERTEWHNIVVWRGLADIVEKYVKKGSQIYIEGKLKTRSWEHEGIKRYATDIYADNIELLGSKPEQQQYGSFVPPSSIPNNFPTQENTDDLPF